MTAQHDWPYERPAERGVRPWFLSAEGYLFALFKDPAEALRAKRGLSERGVSDADVRIYTAEEIVRIESQVHEERSALAKATAALTEDRSVKKRYLDNAKTGGVALWLFSPTVEASNRFVRLLAEYDYSFLRYYGKEGVNDIRRE